MQPLRGLATIALLLTLAGCSSDGGSDAGAGGATSTPTSTPASTAPALVADPQSSTSCIKGRDGKPAVRRYGVSEATAVASGDLTIVGAEALGTGVSLFDSEGVLVISNEVPMGFGDTGWPMGLGGKATSAGLDTSSRTPLVGMRLTDGQRVQPLLGLRIADDIDDAALTGVRLTFTSGDGSSTDSVDLPLPYAFPSGDCPSTSTTG